MQNTILVKGIQVVTFDKNNNDYISLSDIAKYLDKERTNYIIQNWMRTKNTIEFLGLWEKINNKDFKGIEFEALKMQSGSNSFSLTPSRWIEETNAIGITVTVGRYHGGVFAHKDIAFEFASWISPEFKLYLIKEFQRLKEEEKNRLSLDWNVKRILTKINYHLHTDAIKNHLLSIQLRKEQIMYTYANEADLLNVALFGKTASEWKKENPQKKGNIRDHAEIVQLVILANLETINAELIKQHIPQQKRIVQLNRIAVDQMKSFISHNTTKSLNKLSFH